MPHISEKRLYFNADKTKVVEEGSSDAAYLFVAEGGQVSDEDARKYGVSGPKADDKPAEVAPIFHESTSDRDDDRPKAADKPREAPERAEEPREADAKADTEDKAIEAPNPTFRTRKVER